MDVLPKIHPIHEHVDTNGVNMPDMLERLAKGGFTGYLHHTAPQFAAYCIFSLGKLICAISSEKSRERTGLEALTAIFEKLINSEGEISIYRMTPDLSMCAHALVQGTRLFDGDEVRQVDMKGVLARLKNQGLNGVVLFSAPERHAMIFYKSGQSIGFYHDGASALDASPEESRKVAALPRARLFVYSTKPIEDLMRHDLLQLVNLDKLWSAAKERSAARRMKATDTGSTNRDNIPLDAILTELAEDLQELAMAYLSKEGRAMVQQQLEIAGGCRILTDSKKAAELLVNIRQEAGRIDSHARIDEMVDLMKTEIAARLAV